MVKSAVVTIKVEIEKVGVYRSVMQITDAITGEEIVTVIRSHPKRQRAAVARSQYREAVEILRDLGYDSIAELITNEPSLRLANIDY